MVRWLAICLLGCASATTPPPVQARAAPDDHPAPAKPRATVTVTVADECGFILDQIYFPDGAAVPATHQTPVLDDTAAMFTCLEKQGTHVVWEIQGHADSLEPNGLALSDARARWVRDELAKRGVPPAAMAVNGYGDALPLDRANTPAARAKNRRVSFLNLGKRP